MGSQRCCADCFNIFSLHPISGEGSGFARSHPRNKMLLWRFHQGSRPSQACVLVSFMYSGDPIVHEFASDKLRRMDAPIVLYFLVNAFDCCQGLVAVVAKGTHKIVLSS